MLQYDTMMLLWNPFYSKEKRLVRQILVIGILSIINLVGSSLNFLDIDASILKIMAIVSAVFIPTTISIYSLGYLIHGLNR